MAGYIGLSRVRAIINDSLYGSIPINEIEYSIIQTPTFNRLHHIKQLGPVYLVYPGAKHSRFEHSIGVMHLSTRIIGNILGSMEDNEVIDLFNSDALYILRGLYEGGFFDRKVYPTFYDLCYNIIVQTMRLSGLLHDLGHYPYSHVVEEALGERGLHEQMTWNIISRWSELRRILNRTTYFYNDRKTGITPEHIIAVLMDTGSREEFLDTLTGYTPLLNNHGYDLLHRIISGPFDADRLDYLRRDALHTGIVYGIVDVNRVVENIYARRSGRRYLLYYDTKAIPALENMVDSRIRMFKLVYYHHKNIVLAEVTRRLVSSALELSCRYDKCYYRDLLVNKYVDTVINAPHKVTDNLLYEMATYVLDRANEGDEAYYYASAYLDRRLLPITLFKREEDLYYFILKAIGAKDLSRKNYTLLLEQIINKSSKLLENIKKHTGFELLIVPVRYHGLSTSSIMIDVGGRLRKLSDVSNYVRWIEKYYLAHRHLFLYVFSRNTNTMRSLKINLSLRTEVFDSIINILKEFIEEIYSEAVLQGS